MKGLWFIAILFSVLILLALINCKFTYFFFFFPDTYSFPSIFEVPGCQLDRGRDSGLLSAPHQLKAYYVSMLISICYTARSTLVPSFAPLLFSDGSLQRSRQPSLQQNVPVTHFVTFVQVFFNPSRQKRFVGGLGHESKRQTDRRSNTYIVSPKPVEAETVKVPNHITLTCKQVMCLGYRGRMVRG